MEVEKNVRCSTSCLYESRKIYKAHKNRITIISIRTFFMLGGQMFFFSFMIYLKWRYGYRMYSVYCNGYYLSYIGETKRKLETQT